MSAGITASIWIICEYTELYLCEIKYIAWKRWQDENNPIFCQAGLAKIHCSTLIVSHTLGGRRVGWIMTFVISAILDGCARCLPLDSFSFSLSFSLFLLYLFYCVERRTVLDHCASDYSFFLSFSLSLFLFLFESYIISDILTLMYKYFSISRLFSHSRLPLRIQTRERFAKSIVHERVGRGENSVITYIYKLA